MDHAIITFITLLREQPLIGFAIAVALFLLLLPLKRYLVRKLMTPPSKPDE